MIENYRFFCHKILARGKWMGKSTIGICAMWRMYPHTMPKKKCTAHAQIAGAYIQNIHNFQMVVIVEGCPFCSLCMSFGSFFHFIFFHSPAVGRQLFFLLLSIRIFPDMQKSNVWKLSSKRKVTTTTTKRACTFTENITCPLEWNEREKKMIKSDFFVRIIAFAYAFGTNWFWRKSDMLIWLTILSIK